MFFQIKGQQKFLAWEEHHVFLHIPSQKWKFIFCINMCVYINSTSTQHRNFLWCLAELKVTQRKIMLWEMSGSHSNRQRDPSSLQQSTWLESIMHCQIFCFTSVTTYFSKELVRKSKCGKGEYVADLCSLENMLYCYLQEYMTCGPATWFPKRKEQFFLNLNCELGQDLKSGNK